MRAGIISLLLASAGICLSAVAVSADANPANHGHHYGQLKHQHTPPPPPVSAPPPTTTNPPAGNTSEGPPPPAATGRRAAARSGAGAADESFSASPTGNAATTAAPADVKPDLPNPLQVQVVRAPRGDPLWWLALILAATLVLLWLFVATRLVQTRLSGRRG